MVKSLVWFYFENNEKSLYPNIDMDSAALVAGYDANIYNFLKAYMMYESVCKGEISIYWLKIAEAPKMTSLPISTKRTISPLDIFGFSCGHVCVLVNALALCYFGLLT